MYVDVCVYYRDTYVYVSIFIHNCVHAFRISSALSHMARHGLRALAAGAPPVKCCILVRMVFSNTIWDAPWQRFLSVRLSDSSRQVECNLGLPHTRARFAKWRAGGTSGSGGIRRSLA